MGTYVGNNGGISRAFKLHRISPLTNGPTNHKTRDSMAILLMQTDAGKALEVRVIGQVKHADYEHSVPEFERLVNRHGKLRILFNIVDFAGWEGATLWDNIKFNVNLLSGIERLAMIGGKMWEQWLSVFCKPFTAAEIRAFEPTQEVEARAWLVPSEDVCPGAMSKNASEPK
jgi:hypothetical protein